MIKQLKAGIGFMCPDLQGNINKRDSKQRQKNIWVQNWLLKCEEKVLIYC